MQSRLIASLISLRRTLLALQTRALAHLRSLDAYQVTGLILLCVGISLAVLGRHAAGVTLDEPSEMRYGRRIAAWFMSGFHDQRAIVRIGVLAHYGGLFDALTQLVAHFTPRDVVGTRHAGSALCALAGIVAIATARRVFRPAVIFRFMN